ncbi:MULTISPECIES: hydroxymethylbilane synthase [Campylobacter]|uniref:Porphobilinogen deaminase n=1 Tax=Campylobacter porcelli TaxID=1660073 RepID=A0ABU7M412_9BACT|nr:hydroxymethylbilane synthase [Campylobacter sp. P0124]MCR8696760.1 hydroxymethylbilane synthase [Campylobacter sp. RM19073]MEE3744383.1 hydroxymethylbilane synthase [Campylobacter sp. CX2-4855-23]
MMNIRIASRNSALALWQTYHIRDLLLARGHSVEIITMKTKGDVILDTPLAKIGGKGLFTKELENAMLEGRADIAVHSLKDVPTTFPDGLKLACVCSREDVSDAILSMKFKSFDELSANARVGTTSLRRRMQLLALRPDLDIISLRGNVNSRISKLKAGEFDAIVLAMAGINRLELFKEVEYISRLDTIAAMGQGALGIEAVDRGDILEAIEFLNDEKSAIETTIERAFVHKLNGGCQAPIGINAKLDGDKITIRAILGTPDGKDILKDEVVFNKSDYKVAGEILADKFINKGAKELLIKAEKIAAQI